MSALPARTSSGRTRSLRVRARSAVAPQRLVWLLLALILSSIGGCTPDAPALELPRPHAREAGVWLSRDAVRALPTQGEAWRALVEQARLPVDRPDLANQDDPSNVRVLAKALVSVRTGDRALTDEVHRALVSVQGSERSASALSLAREILSYVIAADLIELEGDERNRFEDWLRSLRDRRFQGRSLRSTHEDRPNNWGTHAGAARIAIAAYLGEDHEVERAARVFRGWVGESDGWHGFEFGSPTWQPDGGQKRYAINPRGARREGHPIGGVLPDDQRRAGPFTWPPPRENYVWEALQGAVVQAELLDRLGYDAWRWGDAALLRAVEWLHVQADFPAEGDDTWIPHLVNRAYGTQFPAPVPSQPGKAMGFTDWTHASAPIPPSAPTPVRAEARQATPEADSTTD